MTRWVRIAALAATCGLVLSGPVTAQTRADDARFEQAQRRFNNELQLFQQEFDRYQQARANAPRRYDDRSSYYDRRDDDRYASDDRYENGYDAARYYRDGNYQQRTLSADDRVYRGSDGRYYCKRNDGTTGLIIGAVGGGILGNVIDGGHSRAVGTLIGGGLGALIGKSVDQQNKPIVCK